MVERWVRRLAGPSADVEDLIHDVFMVALRRRGEFRGDAKVSTWLFRIAQLVVRKFRFRHKLRQCLDILHRSHELAVVPPSPTPLEVVEQRQQNARLYAALDRLPDKYRTAVILCDTGRGKPPANRPRDRRLRRSGRDGGAYYRCVARCHASWNHPCTRASAA
jgi:RNA polymerase sigma-70 factor (ECF subfamily)